MQLTIAIPTYNRNAALLRTVTSLVPQLGADCKLLIIDNFSDTPVSDTLQEFLRSSPDANVTITRNKVNIGGNANIMRCLELCDTSWVWTLGDDDYITPDAIQTILADIAANPGCTYINYHDSTVYELQRNTRIITKGCREFVENIPFLGSVIFMSANVYQVSHLRQFIQYGIFYQYCCASTLVTVIKTLESREDAVCIFSNSRLTLPEDKGANPETGGFSVAIFLGIATIIDVQLKDFAVKKALIAQLGKAISKWLRPETALLFLLIEYVKIGNAKELIFKYHRLRKLLFSVAPAAAKFRYYLYYILVLFPALGLKIVQLKFKRINNRALDLEAIRKDSRSV